MECNRSGLQTFKPTSINGCRRTSPRSLAPVTTDVLEVGTEQLASQAAQVMERRILNTGYGYGGQVDPAYQGIVDKALGAHNAPIIFTHQSQLDGPLLLDVNFRRSKRYIKNILTKDEIWCQGFSEQTMALTSVMCRQTVRDGDEFIVNGSKIWTTLGNYDRMILLAQTDTLCRSRGL